MLKRMSFLSVLAVTFIALAPTVPAQIFTMSREQLVKYTPRNPFDRFPDGRPKVPDELLAKLHGMSAEEVLPIIRHGYANQYADGFQLLAPGKVMVGRAMTVLLIPARPDVSDIDQKAWREAGHTLRFSHQTALDMLQKGDVFVADAGGSAESGGIVGDNLAYYVWKTTGVGFVIDGAIRDLQGIADFGMMGYYRKAVPPAIQNLMVGGINVPVRIGHVTVLPGDIVFGDREGVYFIPPHLVKEIIDEAEITHVHDEWTKKKFDEGKYKSSDIYGTPHDPALVEEYNDYLRSKIGRQAYDEYQKRRQSARPQGPPPSR
jgi:4-hydroxy-4-methyl-2-oxoglutarate aldolase